jgi:RNA polymerase sigma factor (sigma-70 family)
MGRPDRALPLDFDAVYRRHAADVYRFCVSQLGDPVAAEDLAADVFAAAFAAYRRARPAPDELRPWLFRIARNGAIDRMRRAATQRRLLDRLRSRSRHDDVEHLAEVRSELRAAVDAIRRLGRRDRLLVGLRIGAGLSYAEVAAVMGMKEDAARMATTRALRRVQDEVR